MKKRVIEEKGKGGIGAFVLGICALVFFWVPIANLILAILAIIFGIIGIRKNVERKGLAITGLIMGGIVLLFIIISFSWFVNLLVNINWSPTDQGQTLNNTYKIGENFVLGNILFKVNQITTADKIVDGEYQINADGIFYIVELTTENQRNESFNFFLDQFILMDSEGKKYSADSDAERYRFNNKDAISGGQQLQPGLPITGIKIFDLPPSASGLKLEVTAPGFLDAEKAYVNFD
ncbi:DUF4190 and DUF4352 domain-containing protein [Candidatus Pacearchaeota archaeon]|nr:DUF4190 and DUF4352 domain-containing protein [Candidatus Pacearchaeota archaeon]